MKVLAYLQPAPRTPFAAFLKRPQNGGAAGQRDAVAAPFRSSISAVSPLLTAEGRALAGCTPGAAAHAKKAGR
jgi:hypothetical protein